MERRAAVICARGGSKGLPGKNLAEIRGHPLLGWSILQAQASSLFDDILISSDDEHILEAASRYGDCHLVTRPAEFASDTASKLPAIVHAVRTILGSQASQLQSLVDLDTTAIARSVGDIRGAVRLREELGCTSVITGCPSRRSPYFNMVEAEPDGTVRIVKASGQGFVRRQDAPATYDMNAAVYVWDTTAFLTDPRIFYPDTAIYVMPQGRSLDVDSPSDLDLLTWLIEQRGLNPLAEGDGA